MKKRKSPATGKPQDLFVSAEQLVSTLAPIDLSELDPVSVTPFAFGAQNTDIALVNINGVQTGVKNPRARLTTVHPADSATTPSITSYSPGFGNPGTVVTITGSGFGPPQSNSYVVVYSITTHTYFQWPSTTWTDSEVVATVASDMPIGASYLYLVVNGVLVGNTNPFTVGIPPAITSYAPVSGMPGTLMKIKGTGFGQPASTSDVQVYSVNTHSWSFWPATNWTDSEIDLNVPQGFPSENVYIYVNVKGLLSIGTYPFEVGTPPVIDCYSPVSGPPGTLVTINGSGFGTQKGNSYVTFLSRLTNEFTVWPPSTWSDSKITVAVPSNTPLGEGYLSVWVNGLESIGTFPFSVGFPATISGYAPLFGNPGTAITIDGTGFGQLQGSNYVLSVSSVTNESIQLPVNTWSETRIVATIPSTMPLGSIYLRVYVAPLSTIGTYPFTVGIPPSITSYSPGSGPSATVITIIGSGFGSEQANGFVTLESVTNIHTSLQVVSWTDDQIKVSVPPLTPTCLSYLSVTVNGLSSIGTFPFQVTKN